MKAALQEYLRLAREQEAHTPDCPHAAPSIRDATTGRCLLACMCDHEERVDAQVAEAIEAYGEAGMWCMVTHSHAFSAVQALAAFGRVIERGEP